MSNNNYSQAYLKKINGILNVIFNYASKYYDLKNNPCIKAGSMGRHKSKEIVIYTHEQMKVLLKNIYDYTDYTIFSILFYTGMRKDELFALTKKDINSDKGIININKSYQRIAKENVITPPKTPNSIRKVEIPLFLIKNDYMRLRGRLKIAQRNSELTQDFTIHCFKHSHVSLLIELGYSVLIIAEHIGDTVETTLKTYSHLYPDKQVQLVNKLEEMNNSTILVPKPPTKKEKTLNLSRVFSIN